MQPNEGQPVVVPERRRLSLESLRLTALIGVLAVLIGLGSVTVYRQATTRVVDLGFSVVDASGILRVEQDSSADRAGLRTGDRLLSLGGAPFQDATSWNRGLRERRDAQPLDITVARDGRKLQMQVSGWQRASAPPVYFYLALVGFFFIAMALIAAARPVRSPLTSRYVLFSASIFMVLVFSDQPTGSALDWTLFVLDRLGRLSFAALFVLFAAALGRREPQGLAARIALWLPPAALAIAGAGIYAASLRGLLRDPLALWSLKDRAELLVAGVYLLIGTGLLARGAALEAAPSRRYHIRWALWGSAIGLGPFSLLYLIPSGLGIKVPWWCEFSALTLAVLPLTLSGTLFRYRPGDLEIYLKRVIRALSILFFTFAISSAAWVLIDRLGRPYLGFSDWVAGGMAALIAVVLYPQIRSFTSQIIDRLVYGGRYSFRSTLLAFGRELNAELDLESLVAKFQERTRETLDLSTTLLLVRHDRERGLRPVGGSDPVVPIDSPLVERIRSVSYLMLDDLLQAPGAERLESLHARGIQYLFPMKIKGEVRAVLATSSRRGGQHLSTEDVELLVALCGHAAVALESARLLAQLHRKVDEVESLRRFREDILESSRIGILVVDASGAIEAFNEALEEIYGTPRAEALGRTLRDVFPLPLVRRLERQPEETAESGGGIRRLYRHGLTNRRGRRIVVNVSMSPLAATGGGRAGHVITIDDVTDQVKLEEQLLRQDRLASIGLLASGVAHEVNTPLTGISSYTQILLAELEPGDPRAETLRKIEKQTFRAASIVNSLLNFTREGSEALETLRVSDLIDESLALFEPQLKGVDVRIEKRVEAGLPVLTGNRGKLQQVLLNLLLNARDALAEGGIIGVTARGSNGRLFLEIADDGEGITEEDLAKIFDPFFTTKPRGRGTGLGLSISYNIVHEHRGEISVESRRGEGTVFTIELPFETRDVLHA